MNRCLAFFGALLFSAVSVSSACFAAFSDQVRFTLDEEGGGRNQLHAQFRDDQRGRDRNDWSTSLSPADLQGLDLAAFRSGATGPLRFALAREAGRLDCAGTGGRGHGWGDCRFTADPAFTQMLAARGIGTPDPEEAFALMAVNARREVVDAIAAAGFPMPSIDDLTALAALGVDGGYISGLARAGYRPQSIDTLVEFKALGITPEWIAGFAPLGYANLPADDLVQMRALGITPEFVAGFQRIGYRHLSADRLVELKALGVTPEFARAAIGRGTSLPETDDLVQMKLFGRKFR